MADTWKKIIATNIDYNNHSILCSNSDCEVTIYNWKSGNFKFKINFDQPII